MTLLATHPYRFGWRMWFALTRIGRLVSPVEAVMLDGHTLDARCEKDHTPPVLGCTCGVHYWPHINIDPAMNDANPPMALTFGAALEPISPDRFDTLGAMRCRRYRTLTVFLPADLQRLAHRVSIQHGVPVHVGIAHTACHTAATATVTGHAPDWLAALETEALPKPDEATRNYNAAITASRHTRRPLDAQTLNLIEESFSAPRPAPLPR